MKIMICGVSGLIGQALFNALRTTHQLTLVGRSVAKLKQQFGTDYPCITWQDLKANTLATQDCVINLAGQNIGAKRWNVAVKADILHSRTTTTKTLVDLCIACGDQSPRLINASAIGIYDFAPTRAQEATMIFDEASILPTHPTSFIGKIGKQWEAALQPAQQAGIKVAILRFSIVLSPTGGALAKLLPSFKMGMGAVLGSGQQPFSWVTLTDVVGVIEFLLQQPSTNGVFNVVADEIIAQRQFAKTLAAALRKPCFISLPTKLVQLLFGDMGNELLLHGQAVKATRLRDLGFSFQYPSLAKALSAIL